MRRLAIASVVLLFGCPHSTLPDGGLEDASVPDEGVLDTGVDTTGSLIGEVSLGAWNLEQFPKTATTAALVKQILLSLSPDLMGVEEIAESDEFFRFADDLPGYAAVEVDDPRNFLRVGILYKEDRVTLGSVVPLFEDDGYAFPRPPLSAEVTVTSTSGELFDFVFVVVHLKAQGDTESRERRRIANEKIDAWIHDRMMVSEERDYVVVGDFNDRLQDPPGENVFQVFLDQPQLYFFLTGPLAAAGDTSYIPIPGLIDHVLVTTDALVEYGDGSTEVLYLDETVGGYEPLVSDHRPVLSRFKIRTMR